jgi:hypothetical protein
MGTELSMHSGARQRSNIMGRETVDRGHLQFGVNVSRVLPTTSGHHGPVGIAYPLTVPANESPTRLSLLVLHRSLALEHFSAL